MHETADDLLVLQRALDESDAEPRQIFAMRQ